MSDDSDVEIVFPPPKLVKQVQEQVPGVTRADVFRAWDACSARCRHQTEAKQVRTVFAHMGQAPVQASKRTCIALSDSDSSLAEITPRPSKRARPVLDPPIPVAGPSALPRMTPEDHIAILLSIFPDLDTEWAKTTLVEPDTLSLPEAERGDALAERLFEMGPDYPKAPVPAAPVTPRPQTAASAHPSQFYTSPEPACLATRDPTVLPPDLQQFKASYMSEARSASPAYRTIALELLCGTFDWVGKSDVRICLGRHNHLYAPAFFDLRSDGKQPRPRYHKLKKRRPCKGRLFRVADLLLQQEKEWVDAVVRYEDQAEAERQYILHQEADAQLAQNLADEDDERRGRFISCGCCFGDFPSRVIVQCAEGHLFCCDCARKYVEGRVGDRQAGLFCMDCDGCEATFPDSVVIPIVKRKTFELLENIRQQKAIEEAGLTNFVSCPFCSFGYQLENEQERLFYCHNEECRRTSCRTCQKDNHLPKTCAEAENDRKVNNIHLVEEAMTGALLRKCPKCQQPYVKELGCNKMTCANCATISCYICQIAITGYDHFKKDLKANRKVCPLYDNDLAARTAREVEEARVQASRQVQEANPEIQEADLARLAQPVPPAATHPSYAVQPQGYAEGHAY